MPNSGDHSKLSCRNEGVAFGGRPDSLVILSVNSDIRLVYLLVQVP